MKLEYSFCLLLIFIMICKSCSYTIDQVIRESIEKGLKSLTQLKRQLPEDLDEENSRELISGMDKDYTIREEVPDPEHVPTLVRRAIADTNSITKIVNHNCTCKTHKKTQATKKKSEYPADPNKGSPPSNLNTQSDPKEQSGPNTQIDPNTQNEPDTATTEPTGIMLHPSSTSFTLSKAQLNETHIELRELEFQLDAAMREMCSHYKDIPDLDIDSMADVWQLAYYKGEVALTCFKIFLKKTSPPSRKRYRVKYTTFNDTIDWHECYLELGSTGQRQETRRHFLQGSKSDKGILENIVLSHSTTDGSKIITLLDQTPDQWMVTKNLLLMRACESGDVAIFTRIPSKPDKAELEEAMIHFGEKGMNGLMPCQNNDVNTVKENETVDKNKYYMLS